MVTFAEWWVLHTKTGVRMNMAEIASVLDSMTVPKRPPHDLDKGRRALAAAHERKRKALERAQRA